MWGVLIDWETLPTRSPGYLDLCLVRVTEINLERVTQVISGNVNTNGWFDPIYDEPQVMWVIGSTN